MKKKNIINLIRFHYDKNDNGFKNEAYDIAKDFMDLGDNELAEYIMALLSEENTFSPQVFEKKNILFFDKIESSNASLPLPEAIKNDIIGIVNAISKNVGVNKFLFEGAPGTGKTESVKHIARILNKELYKAEFSQIVDSKLGQTTKNLSEAFDEINSLVHPENAIILFDEIDALALDRLNNNDLREMGRATSALLNELDRLNKNVIFIATTNLYNAFDKALIRRFDKVINFDRYSREDLVDVAVALLGSYIDMFDDVAKDLKLFKKIIFSAKELPYPGELKNLIKSSLAFSDSTKKYDYLIRLYKALNSTNSIDIKELKKQGFTVRDMENLTGISKSSISRELNNE